jgi:hypothetical protein
MEVTACSHEDGKRPKSTRNPVKAIRAFCLECVCGSPREVELCVSPECPLYPFRLGKNPYRAPPSEKQREHARRLSEQRKEVNSAAVG